MRRSKPPRPAHDDRPQRRATQPYAVHARNPAGSKLARKFYRAKHGIKETLEKSRKWYFSAAHC